MLVKAIGQLLGDEVLATDGRVGVVDDLYFDQDCWQVCYLVVASGARRSLMSTVCVDAASPARDRLNVAMTRDHLASGAGSWPMERAAEWLDDIRVCSTLCVLGWRVRAEDGPAGEVADLLVDHDSWSIDYLVANIAGPLGKRQLLLPLDWADPLDPLAGEVRMRRTRAQLLCSSSPQLGEQATPCWFGRAPS